MKNSTFIILIIAIAIAAFFLLGKKKNSTEAEEPISDERTKEIEELRALLEKESEGNALSEAEIERLKQLVKKSEQANVEIEKAATERAIKAEADATDRALKAEAEAAKWKDLLDRNKEMAADYYDAIEKSSKDLDEALIKLQKYEEVEENNRLRKEVEDRIAASEAAKREAQEWEYAWSTNGDLFQRAREMDSDNNPKFKGHGYVDDAVRHWLWNMNNKQLAIAQRNYIKITGRTVIHDLEQQSYSPPYRYSGGYRPDGSRYETHDMRVLRDQLLVRLYVIAPVSDY